MSGTTRVQINNGSDWDDEPTQAELNEVPAMTHADLIETMKSAMYKNSSKGRALVVESIKKHGIQGDASPVAEEPVHQNSDEIIAKRQTITNMMKDPRYKWDASYRYEVQSKLANLTAGDNFNGYTGEQITKDDFTTPGRTLRVSVSPSASHGVAMTVGKTHRIQFGANLTGPNAPVKRGSASQNKPSQE